MIYDTAGKTIVKDDIVIYNLSGTLAKGKVIEVVEQYNQNTRYNQRRFTGYVLVEYIEGGNGSKKSGDTSKVVNTDALWVLK
jgi:hypothetical protein